MITTSAEFMERYGLGSAYRLLDDLAKYGIDDDFKIAVIHSQWQRSVLGFTWFGLRDEIIKKVNEHLEQYGDLAGVKQALHVTRSMREGKSRFFGGVLQKTDYEKELDVVVMILEHGKLIKGHSHE